MAENPYSTYVLVELSISEIVALLACAARHREAMPTAQRRALRTAMHRLSKLAIKKLAAWR